MKNRKFKIYKNDTGSLLPISLNKQIPFRVKEFLLFMVKMVQKEQIMPTINVLNIFFHYMALLM